MIRYYKLFDLLNRRDLKKTELLKIMSAPTLAKLNKGEIIKTDIVDKICEFLNVQPGDIMEYQPTRSVKELTQKMNENIYSPEADKVVEELKDKSIPQNIRRNPIYKNNQELGEITTELKIAQKNELNKLKK